MTLPASTPKKREAKRRAVSSLSLSFLAGSDRVADVPMQVISSGFLPGQGPHTPDQAGDLGSRGPGVGVGLVKDEILDRGLGKERHVRRAGGQHFKLPVVRQQDAGLAVGGCPPRSSTLPAGPGAARPGPRPGPPPGASGVRPGMPARRTPRKRSTSTSFSVPGVVPTHWPKVMPVPPSMSRRRSSWSLARAFIG